MFVSHMRAQNVRKPTDGNPFLRTSFTDTADKLRAADNVSPTDSAQAFLTRLRTNVIHQINSCLLLRFNDQKPPFWRFIWAKKFHAGVLEHLRESMLEQRIGLCVSGLQRAFVLSPT